MSHISQSRCQIQNPDPAILRAALETVAQARQGEVTDYFLDWYRQRQSCSLAIHVPELPRGLGINLAEGTWTWVGDLYGVQPAARQLQEEIQNVYVALAYAQVLQGMGYQVQGFNYTSEGVVVEGVQA